MEIRKNLNGFTIFQNGESILYKGKPFTLSAILTNSNGETLAKLKRISWWSLKFKLDTPNEEYEIKSTPANFHIRHVGGGEYLTNGSYEFFSNKGIKATNIVFSHNNMKNICNLEVIDQEHKTAFIVATCVMLKAFYHGGSF